MFTRKNFFYNYVEKRTLKDRNREETKYLNVKIIYKIINKTSQTPQTSPFLHKLDDEHWVLGIQWSYFTNVKSWRVSRGGRSISC